MKLLITPATSLRPWPGCLICLLLMGCFQTVKAQNDSDSNHIKGSSASYPGIIDFKNEKQAPVIAQFVTNPFVGQCMLTIAATENTTCFIRMLNKGGAEMLNSKVLLHKGNNHVVLPAQQLADGFYFLQLRSKGGKLLNVLKGEKRG